MGKIWERYGMKWDIMGKYGKIWERYVPSGFY